MNYNYITFLKLLENEYPDIYIKLYRLPVDSIKGIINNFFQSGLKIENKKHINNFFINQPYLQEYTETEFKLKKM